ncbi:O-succinylbenzoate synthase [Microlunatus sagamiharensis]|uniref:o-succinylbenzoate synthase n=1 Tax=Microlunatus sagamiharensis TaxID=546874 RepID=A0A1H2MZ27_9ACTN|nr:o-succinylbenzoate synthase [Microlunatus sagamiharensis]SDU98410.1 O-succinylbenzoate synthase [Microlunatus sagamiharensis]
MGETRGVTGGGQRRAEVRGYALAMPVRFRGLTRREGLLWRGAAGWAEWSPFLDYSGAELVPWLRAADEAADRGWPAPVRDAVPVNCTVPAVGPEQAHAIVSRAVSGWGCRTAKVKVAERGQALADDLARCEAVRDALGPDGHLRVDANGGWELDAAEAAVRALDRYGLEYVEQPCWAVEDLAALRVRLARAGAPVPVAADESIRRADDPYRVVALDAADVAVLKVAPLGGVHAALEVAERIGLPVVVSSAVETSVGLAAGVALAAALSALPYACGLATTSLLDGDVVIDPLVPADGALPVRAVEVDEGRLAQHRMATADEASWSERLARTRALDEAAGSGRG